MSEDIYIWDCEDHKNRIEKLEESIKDLQTAIEELDEKIEEIKSYTF